MNHEDKPTATGGSTDTVMPAEAAALAETGKDAKNPATKGGGQAEENLEREVDEAIDLPQKGSA